MRKFVRGGSDEAHLVPYEGEEMAERGILTDKEKQGMYTMHCLGESKEAIADRYEVAVSTVYRIIREQREEHEKMASSSQIVAGGQGKRASHDMRRQNQVRGHVHHQRQVQETNLHREERA